jgi:hypothetical protein
VTVLLVLELILALTAVLASVHWWVAQTEASMRLALRIGAAVAILHAARVLIFVLGRTGPWIDFDVRPEQRALHPGRWTWGEVYFAGVASALAVIAVIVIWLYRRRGFGPLNEAGDQGGSAGGEV